MNTQDTQPGCPKPSHTPGPWKHEPRSAGFMTFRGPNGETIIGGCGCCCSPFGNSADSGHTFYNESGEDRANAKLIASAPSLHASNTALREALEKLIHYADGEMTHMEAEIALENAIAAARAALSQSEEAK